MSADGGGITPDEMEDGLDSAGEEFITTRQGLLRAGAGLVVAAAGGALAGPAAARSARSALAGAGQASKKKVFAWSTNYNGIPVITLMKDLISKHAGTKGYKVLFDTGQAGKLADQVAAVQAWVTQGVPAICVLPNQPQALEPFAKRALKKGLIWTCYGGADMKTSNGWIGFSSAQSGAQVGAAAVAWINKYDPTAKVLVHTQSNLPVNKPRYQIPIDLIKARTKATIVATQDADTQAVGLTVTQATLTAHPDLSVVVGLNDDGALGAAQAFKLAGKDPAKVWITGNDGSEEALKAIQQGGYLKGTAALPLDRLAAAVANLNILLINHPPRPGVKVNRIIKSIFVTQHSPELPKLIATFK
jgi:ABC-type sugar transport system substrate-binding protein